MSPKSKSKFAEVRERKDRRAKRMAIGGAVLLAAVLAFEMPKVLNRGHSSSTPPAATTSATSTTPATTSPGAPAAATLAPTGKPTALPNSDVAPQRSKSQLFSFTHFAGKDPFVQQVVVASQGAAPTGGSGSTGGTPITGSTPVTASARTGANSAVRTLAMTGTARISVNGRVELVQVGKSFPSANPLFRLVSISHGLVRIGIAHGSYSSGAQTVTLAAGRSLTLVDTADGVRYQLRLLAAA